ncbi:hypothetical protein BDV59DRAFT_179147 [Aspergillus ambiguus]|uniref:uncharacterized protein n=1 Tax=Aspergillus ambiguus TaxID=176160 RepID=UPI003CCD1E4F
MTTAGDGEFQLNCPSPGALDFTGVNLDEFLNCFDDPTSLNLLGQRHCATPSNVLPTSDHIGQLLNIDDAPVRYARRSQRGSKTNEPSKPSDKQKSSNFWPLSTSPNPIRQLVDPQGRPQNINLEASMNGMFFESDKPRTQENAGSLSSTDLICYRRNLFKVNATVSLPHGEGYLALVEDRSMTRIVGLHAQLHATESLKNGTADLVKASSKPTPSVGTGESQPLSVSIRLDQQGATHPQPPIAISWDRIQFRKSTVKSPHPAGAKQTYRLCVEVFGTLSDGRTVSLIRSESVPIIVRGRSPKCYLADQKPGSNQTYPVITSQDLTISTPRLFFLERQPRRSPRDHYRLGTNLALMRVQGLSRVAVTYQTVETMKGFQETTLISQCRLWTGRHRLRPFL